MKQFKKTYLGDSVYAESDGMHVTLTTENGLPSDPSNTIHLEDDVIDALLLVTGRDKQKEERS